MTGGRQALGNDQGASCEGGSGSVCRGAGGEGEGGVPL